MVHSKVEVFHLTTIEDDTSLSAKYDNNFMPFGVRLFLLVSSRPLRSPVASRADLSYLVCVFLASLAVTEFARLRAPVGCWVMERAAI